MSLVLEFREDKDYECDEIQEVIKQKLPSQQSSTLVDEIIEFVDKNLNRSMRILIELQYSDFRIESPLPVFRHRKRQINFGQWVGVYRFYSEELASEVTIKVVPKIPLQSFTLMLNEVYGLVQMYGVPALDVVSLNLHGYSNFRDCLTYSFLLNRLTELAFAHGIVRQATFVRYSSGIQMGLIDRHRTAYNLQRGIPLIESKKFTAKYPDLFLMLLVRFHLMLSHDINEQVARFRNLNPNKGDPLDHMLSTIKVSQAQHAKYLSDGILQNYIAAALSFDFEDFGLLRNIRSEVKYNEWFKAIVDLFESYLSKRPVRVKLKESDLSEVAVQPLPSSKVYELWILTLFNRIYGKYNSRKPVIMRTNNGFDFVYGDLVICYNSEKLEWSKIFSKIIRNSPRPDMILAGKHKRAVLDAKYREVNHLGVEDIERIISYLVDYSEPQDHDEIKGFLVTLGDLNVNEASRRDLVPNLRIYHLVADPNRPKEAEENLERVYHKVFS
ncbi:MAG: hypothetical protein QXV32_04270 [Conexivisphaerales archaeon]